MTLMVSLAGVALLVLVPFLLAAFAAFTALVKWEYANYPGAWQTDGRPAGFFWSPVSGISARLRSGVAANVVSFKWLFVTPSWARGDRRAEQLLRRLRICVAVWNGGLVTALVAGALMIMAGLPS